MTIPATRNQVSIDLNQFRNGDGTSPYTTSYWDAKKRSCICVDWSKMTRNQRNTLLSLKFITVTIGGAWIAYIAKKTTMKTTKTTTTTPAEPAETAPETAETAPTPAKYDRKAVMHRAWEIFHTLQGDRNARLSYALKKAWAEAKAPKSLKDDIISKVEYIVSKASDIYNYEVIVRDWTNYGKSRTYIKVLETSNISKHYKVYDFGYIDNIGDTYVAGRKDANGRFNLAGAYLD